MQKCKEISSPANFLSFLEAPAAARACMRLRLQYLSNMKGISQASQFRENNLRFFNLSLSDAFQKEPGCKVHPYVILKCTQGWLRRGSLLTRCLFSPPPQFLCPSSRGLGFSWDIPGVRVAGMCPDPAHTSCLPGL